MEIGNHKRTNLYKPIYNYFHLDTQRKRNQTTPWAIKKAPGQKATRTKGHSTHLRVFCPAHKCNIDTSLPGPCFFHGLHTHTTRVVLEHKRENRRQCCV